MLDILTEFLFPTLIYKNESDFCSLKCSRYFVSDFPLTVLFTSNHNVTSYEIFVCNVVQHPQLHTPKVMLCGQIQKSRHRGRLFLFKVDSRWASLGLLASRAQTPINRTNTPNRGRTAYCKATWSRLRCQSPYSFYIWSQPQV
ncbi:hypothetical protein FIU82_16935 (plasmid) [Pseudoalteromonas sp. THAF3]|nr:hypothetical protein FIU82_16935 [Pseudoalteromonas sp. THAF3]